ncbi:hypothetical protein JOC36_001463 [Weissella uvarum]|uniref:hypothetical protein n=1 Tax=Weissella uvarum TaxID=1479233 RepID=UPI001960F9C6|nr:hypothetical protein [Weissella uvarum]MBM7617870.1 hypothetical protein [Weissella uvarum]MCM0596132.1 hypothetical protein [Weissella uvarum]
MADISYFGWTDNCSEGHNEIVIGSTNDYGEIDLTDADVKRLVGDLQMRLDCGEHITLSID